MDVILEKVEKLYTNSLEKHGIDSRAVGWNTSECQILRFDKLAEVIVNKDSPIIINDLGCGYGAMYNYLINNDYKISEYNGYDISDEMLKQAQNLIGKIPCVNLIKSPSLITEADYTFVSGIFNVKFDAKEDEWVEFVKKTLRNMNKYSKKGFSFNLLTSYVDYRKEDLYYADPSYFFDYCKKSFSKKVSLLHDYDLWEWTIIVKK